MNDRNPFTPNFGELPMYMAGRNQEISDFIYVLDESLSAPSRTSLFKGERGSGKTALLTRLGQEAEERGWICVDVSASREMRRDIYEQAYSKFDAVYPIGEEKQLKGVSIGPFVGVEWDNNKAPDKTWRRLMNELLERMQEKGVGLLITIDEVDPRNTEVVEFAMAYQHFIREGKKVALLVAGLPEKVGLLLNGEGTSFLRRAALYNLGPIDNLDIEDAFLRTIKDSGKSIDNSALNKAIENINGHPYKMQLLGFRAWQIAGDSKIIREEHVSKAIEYADRDFEERVLLMLVRELSDMDIAFLKSMAEDETFSKVTDIKKRLGKSDSYVSRYKERLQKAGVVETVGRGKLTFTSPELRDYVKKMED